MQHQKPQMQGCKLLEIEGSPKLAIFELRDSKYWDGHPSHQNGMTASPFLTGSMSAN